MPKSNKNNIEDSTAFMWSLTYRFLSDLYEPRPPVTAHKQFERKEKHMLMVVPTMGSHGREGLAPSEPGGSASG